MEHNVREIRNKDHSSAFGSSVQVLDMNDLSSGQRKLRPNMAHNIE